MLRDLVRQFEAEDNLRLTTVNSIQRKHADAVRDRAIFEAERDNAIQAVKSAESSLEASKITVAELREQTTTLNQRLADSTSENPKMVQLAKLEDELKEALKKAEQLGKKLEITQGDLEYSRVAYQEASSSAVELSRENKEFQARIEILEKKASETLLQIHKINRQGEAETIRELYEEQVAINGDIMRQVERTEEEIRILKGGRRRERKRQSVQRGSRSPRWVGLEVSPVTGVEVAVPEAHVAGLSLSRRSHLGD